MMTLGQRLYLESDNGVWHPEEMESLSLSGRRGVLASVLGVFNLSRLSGCGGVAHAVRPIEAHISSVSWQLTEQA